MKAFSLFAPIAGLLLSSLLVAQTQSVPDKVGYLNARIAVEAHPQFSRVREVQAKAEAELKPLREQVQSLEEKIRAGQASIQELQAYRSALQSLEVVSQRWAEQQNTALQPIAEEIEKVINKLAKEQGFAMVLDQEVAASSGLVIYATPELDLTQAIVRALSR